MKINDYVKRKQNILQRMLAALFLPFKQFLTPSITPRAWGDFMRVVYRIMIPFREEATQLAREFYDDNRHAQLPKAPRHDIFTDDNYPEQWMRETLKPTLDNFMKTRDVDAAFHDLSNRVIKVVEDGARRTIIQGVASDTEQEIRGFARFDPRPPTCAFCTMMISRGPVYAHDTAGFVGSKESAASLWADNDTDAMNEMMNRWHPGCTCVAVPVYKLSGYPTEKQEDEAFDIYKAARKRASAKGAVSFKGILKEMRSDLYDKNAEQDETRLRTSAA